MNNEKSKIFTMQEPTITFINCIKLESLYKEWCKNYDKIMDNSISAFIEWADRFGLINTNRIKEITEEDYEIEQDEKVIFRRTRII